MGYERENIRNMDGYISGEQPDSIDIIKLNTNENPYPPAPEIQKVIADFHCDALRRYPPPTSDKFRDLAAALHRVKRNNLIATRGGDELLRLLITTYVDPAQPIGMTDPTYSLYPVLARIQDCPVVKIPLNEDWTLPGDFAKQINDAGCKLTLLVNPQAPSGSLLGTKMLAAIADELDGVLLIDEAYIDFVSDEYDSIPLIFEHDNIVILRTLSKGYSLAGLRFGYGIGSTSLITPMLEKTRDSFNLDLFSQLIAESAISNHQYAAANCRKIIAERERLRDLLIAFEFEIEPSQTNFLLATLPAALQAKSTNSAEELYVQLKSRGILVRYFPEKRLQNKLRITVGTADQNDLLVRAIESLL